MAFPYIQAAALGVSALNKIFGGKDIEPKRSDYMPTEAEKNMSRQRAGRMAARQGEAALQRIQTMGASGRLSSGAMASQAAGVVQGSAMGANIEPELVQQDAAARRAFAADKMQANISAQPLNLTPEIGELTRAMLLYKGGLAAPTPGAKKPAAAQQRPPMTANDVHMLSLMGVGG